MGKTTLGKDYYVGAGGVQRGCYTPATTYSTPSGPLCFFLGTEKEEAAQRTISKEKVNKHNGGTPSVFALRRIHLPREGGFGCSLGVVLERVIGSFVAVRAVSRIHSDSRKARASWRLRARSRGAAPVPREGLFNICFHFRLRRSPHWGHVFSKCPSTRARVIDPGPFFCAVLRGSRPRYPPSPSSSLPHQTNAWSRTYSPYKT